LKTTYSKRFVEVNGLTADTRRHIVNVIQPGKINNKPIWLTSWNNIYGGISSPWCSMEMITTNQLWLLLWMPRYATIVIRMWRNKWRLLFHPSLESVRDLNDCSLLDILELPHVERFPWCNNNMVRCHGDEQRHKLDVLRVEWSTDCVIKCKHKRRLHRWNQYNKVYFNDNKHIFKYIDETNTTKCILRITSTSLRI